MAERPHRYVAQVTVTIEIHARHAREARGIAHERMLYLLDKKDCGQTCPVRHISVTEHGFTPRSVRRQRAR